MSKESKLENITSESSETTRKFIERSEKYVPPFSERVLERLYKSEAGRAFTTPPAILFLGFCIIAAYISEGIYYLRGGYEEKIKPTGIYDKET